VNKKMMNSAKDLATRLADLEKNINEEKSMTAAYGTKGARLVKTAYKVMMTQLKILADDDKKELMISDKDQQSVRNASNLIYSITLEKPLTKFFREVSSELIVLTDNWNKQLGRNKQIKRNVDATRRILEDALSISEANDVLRLLLKRMKNELHYKPPFIENSRHYLKLLEEDLEEAKK